MVAAATPAVATAPAATVAPAVAPAVAPVTVAAAPVTTTGLETIVPAAA